MEEGIELAFKKTKRLSSGLMFDIRSCGSASHEEGVSRAFLGKHFLSL
jgi:hypothetical protein